MHQLNAGRSSIFDSEVWRPRIEEHTGASEPVPHAEIFAWDILEITLNPVMLISRTSIQTSSDPERLHPTHNTRAIIPGTAPGHTSEYNGNTNPRVAPVVKVRGYLKKRLFFLCVVIYFIFFLSEHERINSRFINVHLFFYYSKMVVACVPEWRKPQ